VGLVDEAGCRSSDAAGALDVDVVGAVDHHLGDVRVLEERSMGP
jgi:hypothetical protein